MNKNFWMNKKVLVTGHSGFKGCWLTKWLDMMGAKIVGFSLPPELKEDYTISQLQLSSNFTEISGDVRRTEELNAVYKYAPDIVIHLAAQAFVGKAKECPAETFETNLMGTVNLLEGLRKVDSVKSIVIVTSDKVYENREVMTGYTESDYLMGNEAYSCSKVCEEQAAKAYYESFFKQKGVGVATARASNTFGGGDYHFDRLIPYLEKCAYEGTVPTIRNPQSIRPWQYILDLLRGYLTLAERLYEDPETYAGSYNFGPAKDELYTVGEISALICGQNITGRKQEYYEAGLLLIDSSKSLSVLGWQPIYGVKEGIAQTTESYRAYFSGKEAKQIYEEAICCYEQKLEDDNEAGKL